MKRSFYSVLTLLFLGSTLMLNAQSRKMGDNYNQWSAGINLGMTHHIGAFNSYTDNGGMEFSFGIRGAHQFNHVFGLRADVIFGNVSGGLASDTSAYFQTKITDFSLSGIMYLGNLSLSGKNSKKINPYFTLGVGGSSYTANVYGEADGADIYEASSLALKIPVGLGMQFRINDHWNVDLNYTYNAIIDGDWNGLSGSGVSGTGTHVRSYGYLNLGVNYVFGKKENAAEWVNPLDQMYVDLQSMQETVTEISTDTDGDGVADMYDDENNTPKGVAVDGRGRALDVDGDGVPDYMDVDPFTPKGATVDASGREQDTDGDGVPDTRDKEPNTKRGAMVNWQGQTIPKGTAGGYMPSIYFAFNSTSIPYANYERLSATAQVMKANPDIKVQVIGHTDKVGSEKYNEELSERRAQAVIDHLVKYYGIDEARFEIVSKGKNDQLNNAHDNINRRVDFVIMD